MSPAGARPPSGRDERDVPACPSRFFAVWALGLAAGIAATAAAEMPALEPHARLRLRQVWSEDETTPPRTEARLRMEAGASARWSDTLAAHLAIGTGRFDDAPADAEATFGGGDTDFRLTLRAASIKWRPGGLSSSPCLLAGKLEPPFVRPSDLVWDDDVRPEGAAAQWQPATGPFDFFLMSGAFVLRSDGNDHSRWLCSGQAAVRRRWPDRSWAMAGAGWHVFEGTETDPAPGPAESDATRLDSVEDLRPLEGFVAGCRELYFPVQAVLHGVVNPAADRSNTAWLAGIAVGRTRAIRGLEASWQWRRVEANAVAADFAGNEYGGGTDRKEQRWALRYRPAQHVLIGLVAAREERLGTPRNRQWRFGLELETEF